MTIDTQEALRLLDELFACIERKDLCGFVGYGDQLRALLSAKEGEPSAANWRQAIHDWYGATRVGLAWDWIEQRAVALRDAEKEKGNG